MLSSEKPRRLVVVEDDPEMRELLREALRNHGYEVTAVGRGGAAEDAVLAGAAASGCRSRAGPSRRRARWYRTIA